MGIFRLVIAFLLAASFVHSTGFVVARNLVVFFAVVFWLALAFWVHRDARRRIDDSFFVFVATLLGLVPPYIGPVVYLLFRPAETIDDVRSRRVELQALEQQLGRARPTCPLCSAPVEPDYLACPVCTTTLRRPCATCNAPLEPLWQMCPYCATSIELSREDLDAALTGEARAYAGTRTPDPIVTSEVDAGNRREWASLTRIVASERARIPGRAG